MIKNYIYLFIALAIFLTSSCDKGITLWTKTIHVDVPKDAEYVVISEERLESKILMRGDYINKKYIPEEIKIFDSQEYYVVDLEKNNDDAYFNHIYVNTRRKDILIFGSNLPFERSKFYYDRDKKKYRIKNPLYYEDMSIKKPKHKY